MKEFQRCTRCILDTTVSDIWFDGEGVCKYCHLHDELEKMHPLGKKGKAKFELIIKKIKLKGKNKKYDCVVGLSGGRDSTYTLLTAIKYGLRPLAVHFNNGWNTEVSIENILKSRERLKFDLITINADWEEFKDLQIAFLKSSTPDADIPEDYAIYSVLYNTANKYGIKYILNGHSFRTEGTSPISWSYMDPLYINSVQNKEGKIKTITSFPHMSLLKLLYYIFIRRIRDVRLLELLEYNKNEVDKILETELGWKYYGGHHHENYLTRFFQSYYLPQKFNIDKRKTELSAMIRSNQITRELALNEIESHSYEYDKNDIDYVITRLGLTTDNFKKIMEAPLKSHDDYITLLPLIRLLKWPILLATQIRLLPHILYLKYAR